MNDLVQPNTESKVPPTSKKSRKIGKYTIGPLIAKSKYKIKKIFAEDKEATFAVKLFKSRVLAVDTKTHWQREKQAYSKLQHNNILKMLDCFEYEKNLKYLNIPATNYGIILEYCSKGDLYEYVARTGKFSETMAKVLFTKIINGLDHMHKNNFVHLDLKLENIFLDSNFEIKIADFDSCREANSLMEREFVGTTGYHAPEILQRIAFDGKKVDIFTVGVMLFIICAGNPPFARATNRDPYYKHIKNKDPQVFWGIWKNLLTFEFSDDLKVLLISMLAEDPSKRPDISDILSSPWMKCADIEEPNYLKELESRFATFNA
jgi:serine/threonine protein kinase